MSRRQCIIRDPGQPISSCLTVTRRVRLHLFSDSGTIPTNDISAAQRDVRNRLYKDRELEAANVVINPQNICYWRRLS